MRRGSRLLLAVFVSLVTAAGAVLALGHPRSADQLKRRQEYQQLLGGLGLGPARDLQRCAFAFDPRLSPACSEDLGPIPAGASFCPYHACSILDYPPERDQGPSVDAQVP